MKMKAMIPLGLFAVLVVFLAIGLTRDPREIPSPLIGKPAPLFTAPRLQVPDQQFSAKDMLGKVWILNTWASWCVACREEHPILMEFAKTKTIPVIGLDYKDQNVDGLKWLARNGDPYDLSITDQDGRIGIVLRPVVVGRRSGPAGRRPGRGAAHDRHLRRTALPGLPE